uniref:ATP synthase complex subunit 8 n=1 Tax=Bifiditermes nr. madagascariensis TaxID=2942751 RepID=A0A8X8RHE0_9NEOP|nr:ATP synthase F0 subunit 8 [Bifiditermes nr. madagascariensis]
MPQMMPMSWMFLFATFSTTLIIMAATNYFTSNLKPKQTSKPPIQKKIIDWKW